MKKCKYSELSNNEIDGLVAERVLGWELFKVGGEAGYWEDASGTRYNYYTSGDFTTSMDACLEHVVPAMRKRGYAISTSNYGDEWVVHWMESGTFSGRDQSLPRVTCIAALMALDAMEQS